MRPLFCADQIAQRVRELGAAIELDHPPGRDLRLIGALKGAMFFHCDLARAIGRDLQIEFVRAVSYGAGAESSGTVEISGDLDFDVAGCDVVLVEDIVDTGRTANALLRMLGRQRPASLKLAALLDKPSRRVEPVRIDYRGFEIPNLFVVGYGMDLAERHRNLPGIWTPAD